MNFPMGFGDQKGFPVSTPQFRYQLDSWVFAILWQFSDCRSSGIFFRSQDFRFYAGWVGQLFVCGFGPKYDHFLQIFPSPMLEKDCIWASEKSISFWALEISISTFSSIHHKCCGEFRFGLGILAFFLGPQNSSSGAMKNGVPLLGSIRPPPRVCVTPWEEVWEGRFSILGPGPFLENFVVFWASFSQGFSTAAVDVLNFSDLFLT